MELEDIKQALHGVPFGVRRRKIEEIARAYGCSVQTIYRRLARAEGKKKEVSREPEIPDEYIEAVGALKAKGAQFGRTARRMTTQVCIDILEQTGVIPRGVLTVSTVNRRLREMQAGRKKAAVRYEADYANQSFQMDFSRSEYFEVIDYDASRDDYVLMSNTAGYYKNKESGKKMHLWLAQVLDEYSRIRLVRYYAAAGENTLMGLQFLHWVWGRPEDAHPLRFVPDYLRTDNGSFAKSEYTKNMLKALDIAWKPSAAGNSRSMGKVERQWRTLWQRYELKHALIAGDKATVWLSELNELVFRDCVEELGFAHPVEKGKTRVHMYRTSMLQHPPREVEIDLVRQSCRVIERKVAMDATITLDNTLYSVPEKYIGRRVRVFRNYAGELVGESIDRGEKFQITAFEAQSFLEYKSYPDTTDERLAKAYDAEGMAEKIAGADGTAAQEQNGSVLYLPPRAQKIEPEALPFNPVESGHFNHIDEAREYIGRALGMNYSVVAHYFDELLEATLDKSIIDEVVVQARREVV